MKFALIITAAATLSAAAANLITNPGFQRDSMGEMGLWSVNLGAYENIATKRPGEGIDGCDAVRFDFTEYGSFKLPGFRLVAKEPYRIGAYVRTSNFRSRTSAVLIFNEGWYNDVRTDPFPENTNGEWVKVEKVVTMPESSNGLYTFDIYAPHPEPGSILDLCQPFIEPMSERALAESQSPTSPLENIRRIIPVTPPLTAIPVNDQALDIAIVWPLPGSADDFDLHVKTRRDGVDAFGEPLRYRLPISQELRATLPALPPGTGHLRLELVRRTNGEVVLSNDYLIRIITPRPEPPARRLNNLVSELVGADLRDGEFPFSLVRDGWVFVGFSEPQPEAAAFLDGSDTPMLRFRPGEPSDAMRFLSAGEHVVRVRGSQPGARLSIRTVPQLMLFPMTIVPINDPVNFRYDLDFFRRHFWHSINTHICSYAWIPKSDLQKTVDQEIKERGIRLIGSGGFSGENWTKADVMAESIRTAPPALTTSGRALDEIAASSTPTILNAVSEACWSLADFDKTVYVWMAGTKGYLNCRPLHMPFLAGVSNASRGTGKLLMETYVTGVADEAELKSYMTLLNQHLRTARRCAPDAASKMAMMMSGYLTAGTWNCNTHPQTDMKYVLDYFYYVIANDPDLVGLFGVGCYDINRTDEEYARWIGRLIRHYGVEGNVTMLSEQYNFTCNPGHLRGGDFEEGAADWRLASAEPDSLAPMTISGYGRNHLRRRAGNASLGDTVLHFTRSAKAPNRVSQTATGLTPGRVYSLTYVTADPDDIANFKNERQHVVLEASIDGGETIPEKGYEFRIPAGWENWPASAKRREIVTRKIVFKALRSDVAITFSDWLSDDTPGGAIGQKRILNSISLNPYFGEE
ncbi:MAG: hypothetical protein GX937_09980 [Lentisphaerae bacterium]|nr:hypothetical protein [Lentisphaerota bacterium]